MTVWEVLLLVAAGIGGGLAGSIAGLASVSTYPALLLVGLPPVSANIANTVALVANGIGSVWGSWPELRGQRRGGRGGRRHAAADHPRRRVRTRRASPAGLLRHRHRAAPPWRPRCGCPA